MVWKLGMGVGKWQEMEYSYWNMEDGRKRLIAIGIWKMANCNNLQ